MKNKIIEFICYLIVILFVVGILAIFTLLALAIIKILAGYLF